jgi:hypothetical protein
MGDFINIPFFLFDNFGEGETDDDLIGFESNTKLDCLIEAEESAGRLWIRDDVLILSALYFDFSSLKTTLFLLLLLSPLLFLVSLSSNIQFLSLKSLCLLFGGLTIPFPILSFFELKTLSSSQVSESEPSESSSSCFHPRSCIYIEKKKKQRKKEMWEV